MAGKNYDARVQVKANTADAQKALNDLQRRTKKLNEVSNRLMTQGAAVTAAAAAATWKLIGAYAKQEQSERKVAAAIRSSNREGELSVKMLADMASRYQQVSLHGDEVGLHILQMGVRAGIAREDLEDFLHSVGDAAAGTGKSFDRMGRTLAQAMQNPEKNVTTLGSSFAGFTREVEENVKALARSGQKMEAQKLILKTLKENYDGQSEALVGKSGILKQTTNLFGDFQEKVGQALLDRLYPFLQWAKDIAIEINKVGSRTAQWTANIIAFGGAFGGAAVAAGAFLKALILIRAHPVVFTISAIAGGLAAINELMRPQESLTDKLADKYDRLAKSMEGVTAEQREMIQNNLSLLTQERGALETRISEMRASIREMEAHIATSPKNAYNDRRMREARQDLADLEAQAKRTDATIKNAGALLDRPVTERAVISSAGGGGVAAPVALPGGKRAPADVQQEREGMFGGTRPIKHARQRELDSGADVSQSVQGYLDEAEEARRLAEEKEFLRQQDLEADRNQLELLRMQRAGAAEQEIEFLRQQYELKAEMRALERERETTEDEEAWQAKMDVLKEREEILAERKAAYENAQGARTLAQAKKFSDEMVKITDGRSKKIKAIQKALALAELAMSLPQGIGKAVSSNQQYPFPLSAAMTALAVAQVVGTTAAQLSAIRGAKRGGIVPGGYTHGDSVAMALRPGELVLPVNQDIEAFKRGVIADARARGEVEGGGGEPQRIEVSINMADDAGDIFRAVTAHERAVRG